MYRDGIAGGPAPLFFNMPCRDNIESLLHQHMAPFSAVVQQTASTSPPVPQSPSLPSLARSSAFCAADSDMDEVIKAQLCAAAAAAGQTRG